MRLKTTYEWCCEVLEDGDIIDNHFEDELQRIRKDELPNNDLVLCRVEGNEEEGVTNTLWAYVKDGKLPEYFADSSLMLTGYKVPLKYHNELNKYLQNKISLTVIAFVVELRVIRILAKEFL